jgi:hypothetical protein
MVMDLDTGRRASSGLPAGWLAGRARLRLARSVLAILAGVTAAGVGMPVHAEEIYGFESLGANSFIDGQDNWVDQPLQGQGIVTVDASPVNGTKVVGVLPNTAFDEAAFLTRVNDENFSFPAFTGFESDAVIQFDLTGEHIALFALGHDQNGDGMLKASEGEIGPAFGTDDRNFVLQQANRGTAFEVAFGQGNAGGDWYRMQLRIDFTANGGNGSGSVYYRNLTDGDPEFQPVAGLQEIDLRLSDMSTQAGPETWDAMWLDLLNGRSARPSVDNLVPNFQQSSAVETEIPATTGPRLVLAEPNPFRDATVFRLNLPEPSAASLRVYDQSGRRVRELIAGAPHDGATHPASWDGRDDSGRRLAPGVYFYRLKAGSRSESGKVTLLHR